MQVCVCVRETSPCCQDADPAINHFQSVRVPQSSLCLLLPLMMVYGCNFCSQTVYTQSSTAPGVYFQRMSFQDNLNDKLSLKFIFIIL